MFDMKEIGERIRAVRKKAGLSQKEFGQRLTGKFSINTISYWEKGKQGITLENLFNIKEAFNVDWKDLLP